MAYESRNRSESILQAWKSNTELDVIVDRAIERMTGSETRSGSPDFKVPFGEQVSYISIDQKSYGIEYGGGHHHFGILIFRNEKDASEELKPSVDPCRYVRVHNRIVFYDE